MSSPVHRLTGTGALIANTLVAISVYVGFTFIPTFPHQWLAALLITGALCAFLTSASFTPPKAKAHSGKRLCGTVKWFNGTKGYGFITGDDGQEVFLHFKGVKDMDKRKLKPGQRFSYRVATSDRGPQAENVKPL